MKGRHVSCNKNIGFEVLVPHIQSLPAYKGYKNLLEPLPLPRSSFDQNIRIRVVEAKIDALMKKVAVLEVDNANMAAMIATLSSPHDEERYPSPFDPPPTPTQNERLRIKLPARKNISSPGQVDPSGPSTSMLGSQPTLEPAPSDETTRMSPRRHATGPAVPNFTFNTPTRPVRGPMRLSFEAALAGHSQPVVRSPSNAQSPLHHISEYLASTVLPEFLASSPVPIRQFKGKLWPKAISAEDFAALMDETEEAINTLAHHHLAVRTGDRDDEIEGGLIGNTSAAAETMDDMATEDETVAAVPWDLRTAVVDTATGAVKTAVVVDTAGAAVDNTAGVVETTMNNMDASE